jgi:hypothetical protein
MHLWYLKLSHRLSPQDCTSAFSYAKAGSKTNVSDTCSVSIVRVDVVKYRQFCARTALTSVPYNAEAVCLLLVGVYHLNITRASFMLQDPFVTPWVGCWPINLGGSGSIPGR